MAQSKRQWQPIRARELHRENKAHYGQWYDRQMMVNKYEVRKNDNKKDN